MEAVREQAKGPILPNHSQGEKAVGLGSGPMGADCRSDWVGNVRQAGGECVMKWFPSFGFQRRNRELKEEIDAPADGNCRSSGARRDGRDGATSGSPGVWKHSSGAGCDAPDVG